MKRSKIIAYIEEHGCWFEREGARHTLYINPKNDRSSTIPRHTEINDYLAEKICRDLGIPKIRAKK